MSCEKATKFREAQLGTDDQVKYYTVCGGPWNGYYLSAAWNEGVGVYKKWGDAAYWNLQDGAMVCLKNGNSKTAGKSWRIIDQDGALRLRCWATLKESSSVTKEMPAVASLHNSVNSEAPLSADQAPLSADQALVFKVSDNASNGGYVCLDE